MGCQHRMAGDGDRAKPNSARPQISHSGDRGEKSSVGPASGFSPSLFPPEPVLYFFL